MVVVVVEVRDPIGVLMTPFIYFLCTVEYSMRQKNPPVPFRFIKRQREFFFAAYCKSSPLIRRPLHPGLGQLLFYVMIAQLGQVVESVNVQVVGILMAPNVVSTQF